MSTIVSNPATLLDLLKVEGKAELIGGRIVTIMPSGDAPSTVALEIVVRVRDYANLVGRGKAYADGTGFALASPLPNGRQSFCPDAAYFTGKPSAKKLRFVEGAPDFAVEVRSEDDYGPKAERDMATKRADYFAAGTQVVWDVDTVAETITAYKSSNPAAPVVFRRGDAADAEPALPGWRLPVDEVFG